MREGALLLLDGSVTQSSGGVVQKPRFDSRPGPKTRSKAGRRIGLDWGATYRIVEFVDRGQLAPYPFPTKGGYPDPMFDKSSSDNIDGFDGMDWLAESVYDLVNGR